MPARQPFTALCRAAAHSRFTGRADLHVHTVYSDGAYTPAQVVDLARRSGLAALAITDHDTLGASAEARAAAAGSALQIVCGVEISTEFQQRELHLLGYFFDTGNAPLRAALNRLAEMRAGRFWDMVERLKGCGVSVGEQDLPARPAGQALGRRHLADLLVKARRVKSVREAFVRYLSDGGRIAVPKARLPVAEAIALLRGAGGVAAWAHPSYDCTGEQVAELRALGLGALEVAYPAFRAGRILQLRALATQFGLAVTGGSDCHGPEEPRRTVGACSISSQELQRLREMAVS